MMDVSSRAAETSPAGRSTGACARPFQHRATGHLAALILDDDEGTRHTFAAALKLAGFDVSTTRSGAEGIVAADSARFDVAVIDQRLPDMPGLEAVLEMRKHGSAPPFILVSAFLTTESTVQAMKLGAQTVLDKPLDVDCLCAAVLAALQRPDAVGAPGRPLTHRRSTVERWARRVLQVRESDEDPKTLDDWARSTASSYSSLRESCRLLGIPAHAARDLARLLRAVTKAHIHGCGPEVFLDVSDDRTLRTLFRRGGLEGWRQGRTVSIDEFLRYQRFIDPNHEAMKALRSLIAIAVNAAGATESNT